MVQHVSNSWKDSLCHLSLQREDGGIKPQFTLIVLKSHVVSVIEEFPMELSYSPINLFLNLLGTLRSPMKAPRGPPTYI